MELVNLISEIQNRSGYSSHKSKQTLVMMVEVVSGCLDDNLRREFAANLPDELSDIALSVYPIIGKKRYDFIGQFMYYQNITRDEAIHQIRLAWQIIRDYLPEGANYIEGHIPSHASLRSVGQPT